MDGFESQKALRIPLQKKVGGGQEREERSKRVTNSTCKLRFSLQGMAKSFSPASEQHMYIMTS